MEWHNALTALAAFLGAAGTVWVAMVKARTIAVHQTERIETQQRNLEVRLRQEQVSSEIAQAEIETAFRREIQVRLDQQSIEINTLRIALRASEEREHILKLRILELEMELSRVRSMAGISMPTPLVVTTTTTTAEVKTVETQENT